MSAKVSGLSGVAAFQLCFPWLLEETLSWVAVVRLTLGPPPSALSSLPVVSMSSSTSRTRIHSAKVLARRRLFLVGSNNHQSDSERSPEAFIVVVSRHDEMNLRVVHMLKVMRAENSPLCLGESSTCAGFPAMPDGNFVVFSKEHAYVKSKTASTIAASFLGPKYDGVEGKTKKFDLSLLYLAK